MSKCQHQMTLETAETGIQNILGIRVRLNCFVKSDFTVYFRKIKRSWKPQRRIGLEQNNNDKNILYQPLSPTFWSGASLISCHWRSNTSGKMSVLSGVKIKLIGAERTNRQSMLGSFSVKQFAWSENSAQPELFRPTTSFYAYAFIAMPTHCRWPDIANMKTKNQILRIK